MGFFNFFSCHRINAKRYKLKISMVYTVKLAVKKRYRVVRTAINITTTGMYPYIKI